MTVKHRLSKTPEHLIWSAMNARCNNPNNKNYGRYGARGISVCERWKSFEAFIADMGPRPSKTHSLDRRDNDGNYEPSNCRWATKVEQSYNRCTNKFFEYRGKMMSVAEAVKLAGSLVKPMIARSRINTGWSVERAVETPNLFRRDPITGREIREGSVA